MRLRFVSAIGLSAVALALAGCGAIGGSGYSDLDRERQPGDELPRVGEDQAYDNIDADSSRFAGEYDGVSVWLAQGTSQDTPICLVAIDDDSRWVSGCGGGGTTLYGVGLGSFTIVHDGMGAPDGATAISENVYAVDGSPAP